MTATYMFYSSKQLAKALIELDKEDKNALSKFLAWLKNKNLLSQLPNIVKQLDLQNKKEKEFEQLKIIARAGLDKVIIKKIKKFIKVPEIVEVDIRQDENIKGGFVARYEGRIYDGSVRMQMEKMKGKLVN